MVKTSNFECTTCGKFVALERRSYRYVESGLTNVILQDIEMTDCPHCGNSDLLLPRAGKIHRAIAQALANSPARLTGEQLRFLRTHIGMSGEEFSRYLHTDKTKISKWERGEDRIGPATDRLVRLVVAAIDSELRPGVSAVAEHLPLIGDESGNDWELHVDVTTLQTSFLKVSLAA